MLDTVHLLVSERTGHLEQKIEPRMVDAVTVTLCDKYELFEAIREVHFL